MCPKYSNSLVRTFKILYLFEFYGMSLFSISEYIWCSYCSEKLPKFNIKKVVLHCKTCVSMVRLGDQYRFVCLMCSYHTINSEHFKRHVRKHTGDKPFKCKFCNFRSSRKDTTVQHVRIKHGSDEFEVLL
uniref:Zinc finger protein 64 homolog, isoforms 1 and 2 n=1 Tax=Cacopsylla melanoneura TaxID=428564 RepID=A0A8D8X5Y4_9HEMI